ncbi:hypothetical protein, partial [Corynebacterium falsenii]|uniref:hypothetical protein n=1 Tax=Corynebacterium falsenii TaxID=108486 RepID=UPI003FD48B80
PCGVVGFYSTDECDTRQVVSGIFSKNIPSLCLDEGDTGAGDAAAARCLGRHHLQPPEPTPTNGKLVASNKKGG